MLLFVEYTTILLDERGKRALASFSKLTKVNFVSEWVSLWPNATIRFDEALHTGQLLG